MKLINRRFRIVTALMMAAVLSAGTFAVSEAAEVFPDRKDGSQFALMRHEMDSGIAVSGMVKGRALKKGSCIGITAPAGFINDNNFTQSVMFLRKSGFKVKIKESCLSREGYFGGDDKKRAEDLNELFEDDSVDAIMCVRGGYGSARILDYLDYDMIAKHPKLLIGYSDITALHIALQQKSGLATVHGPMMNSFTTLFTDYITEKFQKGITLQDLAEVEELPEEEGVSEEETPEEEMTESADAEDSSAEDSSAEDSGTGDSEEAEEPEVGEPEVEEQEGRSWSFSGDYTVSQFLKGITSSKPIGEITLPEQEELKTLVPGTAEGIIIGGNLAVLDSLIGTEYELRGDHAILFIEEVGESAYRIDRMLNHMYQNGLFDRVDGILIGDMRTNTDMDDRTVSEVIEEYASLIGKPCIAGVPAGHGKDNMFLPFGVRTRISANEDGTASVRILEAALTAD